MSIEVLQPVDQNILDQVEELHPSSLGQNIQIHSDQEMPEWTDAQIAIFGVCEDRRAAHKYQDRFNFNKLRLSFYELFPGNWHTNIIDLGDIAPGKTIEDTEFAMRELLENLMTEGIIPIVLGGSQDLTYMQYRAFDYQENMVNLVNIDARFDIGNSDSKINDRSYVGKMIVEKPFNLFNYANIGYQTYLNPLDEIDLIEKLFFESYRLGEISADITTAEPILRDADLVSMDINSVSSVFSKSLIDQPNGFNGKEISALSRYAGISDKVKSFGLYNLQTIDFAQKTLLLPAEIIWYFIEGVNFRKNEHSISSEKYFLKYKVPLDNEVLTFYKSKRSERWWVEIPTFVNNKKKEPTFLPCSHQDYLEACNQEIPDRWYKARRKNEI